MKRMALTGRLLAAFLFWAGVAFAAPPADGVYEKHDEDGRLMSRLVVVSPQDSFEGGWSAPVGSPYVAFVAYDEDGERYEISTQYVPKSDEGGIFERGAYLSHQDLALLKQFKLAAGRRFGFGRQLGEINLGGADMAIDLHSGDMAIDRALSGEYKRTDKAANEFLLPSLLLFLCELNGEPGVYTDERYVPFAVRPVLTEGMPFPFAVTKYEVKRGSVPSHEYYVDNKLRLVMRFDTAQRDYSFPYVSGDYLADTADDWQKARPTALSAVNAMRLYHFLLSRDEYRKLLTKYSALRFVDFYSGEGKKAVTTCEYILIDKNPDSSETKKLRAIVQDNGNISILKEY